MGMFTDYFLAATDGDAAGFLVRGPSASGVSCAEAKWIDGAVAMATLEGILTGRDHMAIAAEGADPVVAVRGEDGPWVIRVRDELVLAVAAAGEGGLRRAATEWALTEELASLHSSGSLFSFLETLQPLCRHAVGRSQHIYCWMCL